MANVTIVDIAKEAGVSIATVSRVINGNYPVKASVKEKVNSVMNKLDYHPNVTARSLRCNNTYLMAFVIADLSNRFFMEIAKGLESVLMPKGYQLVISATDGDPEKEGKIVQLLLNRQIDGLILASSSESRSILEKCKKAHTPLVLIDRAIEGVSTNQVVWNDTETTEKLTNILIKNGHKRIGIINVSLNASPGKRRLEGYKKALNAANIEINEAFISKSNFDSKQAYNFVIETMLLPTPPTAFVCCNNVMLDGALEAIRDLKLEVKKDVALTVFGNAECNKYIKPEITSAYQDTILMGKTAGNMMKELLAGEDKEIPQITIPTVLILGDSV